MTFKQALTMLPLLVASFFSDATSPFYELKLTPLTPHVPDSLAYYQGQVLALMLIQPNCSWCKKQHKLLQQMYDAQSQDCQKFSVLMMATGAQKRQLKRLKAQYQSQFAMVSLPNSLANLLESKSTPQLFILDSQGNLVTYHIGFMPEISLRAHMDPLTKHATCRIRSALVS
ncbi:hypothetical protein J8M20_21380 [Pseudoalteromonas luteoviolacea]|uniref:TlpA family protein disulfide reductase n=1 Tax=Pseudoalteromonas luteoviolacea TaxID=43657 RepID=UPI001B383A1C|nr:hypothetical protein [Pseudoalteromonas luteoviolacea]MBQ4813932.1 hypothetical protein [Pseudoalteromonas luteoviolacea]